MKNLYRKIDGTWINEVPVSITKEQKELLYSKKEEDKEAVKALSEEITSMKDQPASTEDSSKLEELYTSLLPTISETDKYTFISMNVSLEGANTKGILNYRLNDEHKQIRF